VHVVASEKEGTVDGCPVATQNITVNLANRQIAIEKAKYGPMIPSDPNNGFWSRLAKKWNVTPAEAKKARCLNCAAFIRTPQMLDCIAKGLGNETGEESWGTIHQAKLGFCSIFDFKCAGDRTCDAWVTGGPITKPNQ
jgi:hypothetical protein